MFHVTNFANPPHTYLIDYGSLSSFAVGHCQMLESACSSFEHLFNFNDDIFVISRQGNATSAANLQKLVQRSRQDHVSTVTLGIIVLDWGGVMP